MDDDAREILDLQKDFVKAEEPEEKHLLRKSIEVLMIKRAVDQRVFAEFLAPAVKDAISRGAAGERVHLRTVTRDKVRAKVRTMASQNKLVGLPGVTEYTCEVRKRQKRSRVRDDPESGRVLSWERIVE